MLSLFQQWRFLDSSSLSKPDYYHFTQQFVLENMQGSFAIISEPLPLSIEIQSRISRSDTGARLATKAAKFAFIELLDNKLNFSENFLSLFDKHWQAIVLLHAIENPFASNASLLEKQLNDDKKVSSVKKEILEHYDPSIAFLYLFDKQLILLQLGYTQVALLSRRYHCEIKKASQLSLSNFLLGIGNNSESQLQLIDIDACQIEMVVLLSQQYTSPKTVARLNSNIIKLYREFDLEKKSNHIPGSDALILLKKEPCDVDSSVTVSSEVDAPVSLVIKPKLKLKKRSVFLPFTLFFLIFGITASYYLWQVQATVTESNTALTGQQSQNYKISNSQKAVKMTDQERSTIVFFEQQKLKKQQEEIKRSIIKSKEAELRQQKKAQLKKEAEQAYVKEEKKQKLIAQEEKKLRQQKEGEEKVKELERKQRNLEQQEAKLLAEEQAEKRRLVVLVKLQREQEVKLLAEEQAEKRRLKALVKLRREEFEKNKARQKQQVVRTLVAETSVVKSRKQQQLETQQNIKKRTDKKRQDVLAELKKQQQAQARAKDARAQLIQKTAVHQLVNYSKSFNRHVVQLKQKLDAIVVLDRQADALSNSTIIRKRALLETKEKTGRKRLDAIAKGYSTKIKQLCTASKIYPVSLSGANQVERIARSVIAQQLRNCSRPQFLSTKAVTTALLNKYLK